MKHNFLATYSILLIIGVVVQTITLFLVSLTINLQTCDRKQWKLWLYRIYEYSYFQMSVAILLNKIDDIFLYGICVFGQYIYVFYFNYIVEQILGAHKSIFVELYVHVVPIILFKVWSFKHWKQSLVVIIIPFSGFLYYTTSLTI